MINVVLVDDHELVRMGFQSILEKQPDINVLGGADSGEEGLALIREKAPDIALVDVHMPGMSGLELTERISRSGLETRVLIVTVIDDIRFPHRLIKAGAQGYITKCCAPEELLCAVRHIMAGARHLSPNIAQKLAMSSLDENRTPFDQLSSRELEVAMMLVRGVGLKEVGLQLNLSPKTISTYKQRLLEKLGVSQVVELAYLMMAHGLLDTNVSPPVKL